MATFGLKQAQSDAAALAGASRLARGTAISVDWPNHLVVVNISGGEVAMPMVNSAPFAGDNVWVGYLGEQPICLGVIPRAAAGTVAVAASGGKIGVTGDDGVLYDDLPYLGTAPGVGVRCIIDWDSGGFVLSGAMASEPTVKVPVVPPTTVSSIRSKTFNPTASGNYRSGGYTNSGVEISTTRRGFYWYGTQIANTIPNSATILEARIYLRQEWDNVPGVYSNMGIHSSTSRTSSQPTLSGSLRHAGGSRWVSLGSFGNSLADGAAYGVGWYSGSYGWRKYSPAGTSGQIYIKWET